MSDTSLPSDSSPDRPPPPTYASGVLSLLRQIRLSPTGDGSTTPIPLPPASELPAVPGFVLLCELGRGGMGVVYKARQQGLSRFVALKMVGSSQPVGGNELVRFLAEAEIAASVRHPNVVEVYDLGQHDGRPYFVMEFVAGGSLAQLLRSDAAPTPAEFARLLAAVARGVHAAHEAGIVHRDLKPGNVLLSGVRSQETGDRRQETGDGQTKTAVDGSSLPSDPCLLTPKVTDFGLAKRTASDLTRSQAVMGTPAYMAPEQAGGKAKFVGPGADVYALGVILYECLTRSLPFQAEETWSLIRKVVEDPPEPPHKRVPGVPRDVELICLKCLEKEPHHRYPTAAALADDLEAFADGRAVSVRPVGAVTRTWRWARKNPYPAALAVVLLALALVVPPVVIANNARMDKADAVAAEAREKEAAADEARRAAEKLADARELFGLTNDLRRRAADRHTAWTWAVRNDLKRAADLARSGGVPADDLRAVAAVALLSADLRQAEHGLPTRITASVLAARPDGLVAAGEFKTRTHAAVRLLDPAGGKPPRDLEYPVEFGTRNGGLGEPDGTRLLLFSPDGRSLFAGTRDGDIHRFDLDAAGKKPATSWPSGYKGRVSQLAVSPDGKWVYGFSTPSPELIRWDAATGKESGKHAPGVGLRGLAVHPVTGELVACDGVHFHRLTPDLKPVGERVAGSGDLLTFACGGRLLFGVSAGALTLFDPTTLAGEMGYTDPDVRGRSHQSAVTDLAVHPSGAYVATAADGSDDRRVKVWEVASGRRVASVPVPGTVPIGLAWAADGRTLLATAAGKLLRFEFAPPTAERAVCLHPLVLEAAAISPDGTRVAALGATGGDARDLLVQGGGVPAKVLIPGFPGGGRAGVTFDPLSDRVVATGRANTAFEWRPGTEPRPLHANAAPPWTPRFAADGSRLWAVTDAADVQGFDPAGGILKNVMWSNTLAGMTRGLATVEALAAGRGRVVAGGRNGTVVVLDRNAKKQIDFMDPLDPVLSVALSPDEQTAAAGTSVGKLRLMRLADKTDVRLDAHVGGTTAVTFSRDGKLLATGGKDRAVRLWRQTATGYEVLCAVENLPSPVLTAEFSRADGKLLVLLANEHAARVWDTDLLQRHLGGLGLGW